MDTRSLKSKFSTLFDKLRIRGSAQGDDRVKSFKADQQREAAFENQDRGIRQVPLDRIVGSVGRYQDFDSRFRFKEHIPTQRMQGIKEAMRSGKRIPAVKLFQIKDEFYVLDGNHRIAAAKELGWQDIRAHIQEFIPSRRTLENLLYRQRAEFAGKTGLSEDISLTEIGRYAVLLKQINDHMQFLEEEKEHPVSLAEAATDWYQTIFIPMARLIEKSNLLSAFPGRTLADLYTYISFHQWEDQRKRAYGIGIDHFVPKDMEEFRKKMADKTLSQYPEMVRGITAFVLMKVQGKRESRIIDKLYEFDEVEEIHSVHGNIDILVKAVLTRDILTSDAEVISHFVHGKIRQIPGVNSTQTLIPGLSKIKPHSTEGT